MWDADFPRASTWKPIGTDRNPCRVMAVVEGYVVARYKGCAPFIRGAKEFVREFERVDAPKRKVDVRALVNGSPPPALAKGEQP